MAAKSHVGAHALAWRVGLASAKGTLTRAASGVSACTGVFSRTLQTDQQRKCVGGTISRAQQRAWLPAERTTSLRCAMDANPTPSARSLTLCKGACGTRRNRASSNAVRWAAFGAGCQPANNTADGCQGMRKNGRWPMCPTRAARGDIHPARVQSAMFDKQLLRMLVCPTDHTPLAPAGDQLVARVNREIAAGRVANRAGRVLDQPIDADWSAPTGPFCTRSSIPFPYCWWTKRFRWPSLAEAQGNPHAACAAG